MHWIGPIKTCGHTQRGPSTAGPPGLQYGPVNYSEGPRLAQHQSLRDRGGGPETLPSKRRSTGGGGGGGGHRPTAQSLNNDALRSILLPPGRPTTSTSPTTPPSASHGSTRHPCLLQLISWCSSSSLFVWVLSPFFCSRDYFSTREGIINLFIAPILLGNIDLISKSWMHTSFHD